MVQLAWPLVTSINNTQAIPITPRSLGDIKSARRRKKNQGRRKLMQTNFAECCPDSFFFQTHCFPVPPGLGFTHRDLPSPSKARASLSRTSSIRNLCPGCSDPDSFPAFCTIDEGSEMIPLMPPYASGDSRGLNSLAGLLDHREILHSTSVVNPKESNGIWQFNPARVYMIKRISSSQQHLQ